MKLPELCEEEGYVIRVHLCLLLSKIGLYRPEIVVPIIGLRIVRDLCKSVTSPAEDTACK